MALKHDSRLSTADLVVSHQRPSCEPISREDMCCNACLLLMLGTSAGESGYEGFTQAFVLAILMVLGFIVVVCWASIFASALHRYVFKGDGRMWINGRAHDTDEVSTALTLGGRAVFLYTITRHSSLLCITLLPFQGSMCRRASSAWTR